MTNYERIKSMTKDEMIEFLFEIADCDCMGDMEVIEKWVEEEV
jgi:hypothetical protein